MRKSKQPARVRRHHLASAMRVMDGQQNPPVFATPKIEFDGSIVKREDAQAESEKDANTRKTAYRTGLRDGWSCLPVSTASVDTPSTGDRVSSEIALFAAESKPSVLEMKLLTSGTVGTASEGRKYGGGDDAGGSSTRDGSGSMIATDFQASPTADQSALQRSITEAATAPAVTPAAYLNIMTGMLMSQVRTTRASSRLTGNNATVAPSRDGGVGGSSVSGAVFKKNEPVGTELNSSSDPGILRLVKHSISGSECVTKSTTVRSASSTGLNMEDAGESTIKQAATGEISSIRLPSSGLHLQDFWRNGVDVHPSAETAHSGDGQKSPHTAGSSTITENDDRSNSNEATYMPSVMSKGTIKRVELQKPVSMCNPERTADVVGLNHSANFDREKSSGTNHDVLDKETALTGRTPAASVQSEISSTRDSVLSRARGLASQEGPVGRVSEQDGGESDTVDVARAAASYSIATFASSSRYSQGRNEAAPGSTIDESTIKDATASETAVMPNLRTDMSYPDEVKSSTTASITFQHDAQSTAGSPSDGEEVSRHIEGVLATAGGADATSQDSGRANSVKRKYPKGAVSTARRRSLRGNYSGEDIMHEMCMICLEKLSDATEGGGQKMLGLIDSCSHCYCYACILEWSKVTNKCPQCKCRFHTIKAVKELRRSKSRYRGVAVSVEDRDQKYSFVDVRDVVVLDPEVRCHDACLLRGAVDAFEQPGWEFSVQCEQCSEWFHGLCVEFCEESAVPDIWFCMSCRRLSDQTVGNPASITASGSSVPGVCRGASSSRGRGRVRRRTQDDGPSAEQDPLPLPITGRGRDSQEAGNGETIGQRRTALGLRRSVRDTISTSSQQALSITASSSSLGRTLSTSSSPQSGAAVSTGRGRGRTRSTRRSPSPSPPLSQVSLTIAPPRRRRVRLLLSETTAEAAPAQGRSIAQLPQTAPVSTQPTPASTSPTTAPSHQRGCEVPELSYTMSSSSLPTPVSRMLTSPLSAPTITLPAVLPQAVAATAPAVPAPPVSLPTMPEQAVFAPAGQLAVVPSPTVLAQALHLSEMPVPAEIASGVIASAVPASVASLPSVRAPEVVMSTMAPSTIPVPPVPAPTVGGLTVTEPAEQAQATPAPTVPASALTPSAHEELPQLSETLSSSTPSCSASDGPSSSDTPSAVSQHQLPADAVVLRGAEKGINAVRPKLPEAPALSFLQSLEAPQATELCDICGFDTERENLIVYCGSCHIGVHQTCYGISKIPNKEWYCSPCSAGVHPSTLDCRFCPVKGGALKRCTDGSWGHIMCAFWIPECCFLDPDEMEPIGSINKRGETGKVETFLPTFRSRKCYICGTTTGCVIRCHTASCKFHLHPMCGGKAGSVYMEIENTRKTRSNGEEYENVTLVARCPRHNKRKTSIDKRDRRSRGAASLADPLGIVGRTLEITDPERNDGLVLKGKVTWYNPQQSRYCFVESSCDNGVGSGGATTNWAHWIAADKLVEVKAVCVQSKGRERFVVEQPPSADYDGRERQAEDKTDYAADLGTARVKDEEGVGAREGIGATSACQVASERVKEQSDGNINEHSNLEPETDEENFLSTGGKSRRSDKLDVLGQFDATRSNLTASLRAQTQTKLTSRCDSVVIQQESADASQSSRSGDLETINCLQRTESAADGDDSSTSATQTREREAIVVAAGQQQRGRDRLPAVHVLGEPCDSWRRYPIRGRKRQQSSTAPNHSDPDILQDSISSKRARLMEQEDGSCANFQNSIDIAPGTAEGSASSACAIPIAQGSDEISSSQQTMQEQTSTKVQTKDCEMGAIEPLQPVTGSTEVRAEMNATGPVQPETARNGLAYEQRHGWPSALVLLGQMPIMRVHTVSVAGQKTKYFASGYADVESIASNQDSTSRLSFRFEDLEEMITSSLHEKTKKGLANDMITKISDNRSHCSERADVESDTRQEIGVNHEDMGVGSDRNSFDGGDQRTEELQKMEDDDNIREEDHEAVTAADFAPSSPPSPDDVSEMEDGEIETLSDGRAKVMPLNPPKRHKTDKVSQEDVVERTVGSGLTGDADVRCGKEEPYLGDMEISSDDMSMGEAENEETVLMISSDEEFTEEGDVPVANDSSDSEECREGGDNKQDSTADDCAALTEPEGPGSMCIQTKNERKPASLVDTSHGFTSPTSATEECAEAVKGDVSAAARKPEGPQPYDHLREIVRQNLEIRLSAGKNEHGSLASRNATELFNRIAADVEAELFQRLFREETGGLEYKAKYKQLMLSLGNTRNHRLVDSVLAGTTTPVDLATKDAVGLLKSLISILNVEAVPLTGRNGQASTAGRGQMGKFARRGKMVLLG